MLSILGQFTMPLSPPHKLAPTIRSLILSRLEADSLRLAPIPGEVKDIIAALNSSASLRKIAQLIERSPVVSVEVMRKACCATYASAKVHTIPDAVRTLGEDTLRTLMVEISVRKLFVDVDKRVAKGCTEIWRHSLAVALLANDLCKLLKAGDPKIAYMVGLLHDVGKPIVGQYLVSAGTELPNLPRNWWGWWSNVIAAIHRDVGVAVIDHWNISAEVSQVIRNIDDYDENIILSESNVVRFSNALAKKNGFSFQDVDIEEVDTLIMVGKSMLNISDRMIDDVTEELAERVAEAD